MKMMSSETAGYCQILFYTSFTSRIQVSVPKFQGSIDVRSSLGDTASSSMLTRGLYLTFQSFHRKHKNSPKAIP